MRWLPICPGVSGNLVLISHHNVSLSIHLTKSDFHGCPFFSSKIRFDSPATVKRLFKKQNPEQCWVQTAGCSFNNHLHFKVSTFLLLTFSSAVFFPSFWSAVFSWSAELPYFQLRLVRADGTLKIRPLSHCFSFPRNLVVALTSCKGSDSATISHTLALGLVLNSMDINGYQELGMCTEFIARWES